MLRYCVALAIAVVCVHAGSIQWGNQLTLGATSNAGWGRLIRNSQGLDLLVYSQYNRGYPGSCDASFNEPGPTCVVLAKDTNSNDWGGGWKEWSRQDSPNQNGRNYIQEQGFLFKVPNSNRLLMVMRNRLPDCSWFGLPVIYSDDNGRSWLFLSQLQEANTGRFDRGLWEPFLYLLPNGCIGGFYADETHADQGWNQVVGERVSCDGGRTWGNEIYAFGQQDGVSRPGMPGVARMTNGQTIAVCEVCGPQNCQIYFKISNDGINWPGGLGTPIANQFNGPFVEVLPSGRIVVTSSCTNVVSLSDDQGRSWYETAKAYNVDCHSGGPLTWPAVYSLGGNTVGVIANGFGSALSLRLGQSV